MENSKILLERAISALSESGIGDTEWAVGGGTVLAYYFDHRLSKDIGIFLYNRQFFDGLSPRVNDVTEQALDYQEQDGAISLTFPEGKIDFILAPNLTGYLPEKRIFFDREVFLEDPVEIVVKKLFYRGEFLVSRDLFDLAVVGSSSRWCDLLIQLLKFEDKFNVFVKKFEQRKIELKRDAYSRTHRDSILDRKFCAEGKEIDICEDIIAQYASHKVYAKYILRD